MKKYLLLILLSLLLYSCPESSKGNNKGSSDDDEAFKVERNDNARQLTFSNGVKSSQNPAFSPDGQHILFTRFINGYNEPPSELVIINISTGEEQIIVPYSKNVEHISAPGPVWINGKICWSSDLSGGANEIYTADDDGENIEQATTHAGDSYYIEPVFNPLNTNKIIFEYVESDNDPHHIAIVEIDMGNRVTLLTNDNNYDDRLPSWSFDGNSILFQRAVAGYENWQIYTATINLTDPPTISGISRINQPADSSNCDNSYYINNQYILSSSDYEDDYDITMPNIFAFPINGGDPVRITITPTNEDGAPSCSHDGNWIAFETHFGEDEEFPSEIYIIETPASIK